MMILVYHNPLHPLYQSADVGGAGAGSRSGEKQTIQLLEGVTFAD